VEYNNLNEAEMTVEKNYDITIRVICSIVIPGKSPEIKSLTDYLYKGIEQTSELWRND
jgi:hypothetical protein